MYLNARTSLLLAACCVTAGGWYLGTASAKASVPGHDSPQAAVLPAANHSTQQRLAQLQAHGSAAVRVLAEANDRLQKDDQPGEAETLARPWETGESGRNPTVPLSNQIREFETVSSRKLFPKAGDKVELPLLDGTAVTVDVASVKVTESGDYVWSGHLEGRQQDYPVVVTQGPHTSFGMITTPQGSYSMETVDGVGWLYKNPAEPEISTGRDYLEIPERAAL